jgi:predicted nucleic acid-binding protein
MKVVVNIGPLVFLSKINRLALLQNFGKIIIPKTVLSEIKYKKDDVSVAPAQYTEQIEYERKRLRELGKGNNID